MATVTALMTAEEYEARPDPGHPEELVRGEVVPMAQPDRRHGYVCNKAGRILGNFVEDQDLGRVMSNDSAVITERGPDTVRGADVCYYSYARLPKGPLKRGYGPEIPELVVEVRSKSDRWRDIHEKVAEYLSAGALVVIVLDPEPETAHIFGADEPPMVLNREEELTVPGILAGFSVSVAKFFE